MLDSWIIEELRRQERLQQEEKRPQLDVPVPEIFPFQDDKDVLESEPNRGVIIIDISSGEDSEEDQEQKAS